MALSDPCPPASPSAIRSTGFAPPGRSSRATSRARSPSSSRRRTGTSSDSSSASPSSRRPLPCGSRGGLYVSARRTRPGRTSRRKASANEALASAYVSGVRAGLEVSVDLGARVGLVGHDEALLFEQLLDRLVVREEPSLRRFGLRFGGVLRIAVALRIAGRLSVSPSAYHRTWLSLVMRCME